MGVTTVSAPGKVLIAGGYLVLDSAYSGTVVSTSSRFYTVIQDDPSVGENKIRVRSPQFNDAVWLYNVEYGSSEYGSEVTVQEATENTSKNKFVSLALDTSLAFAAEFGGLAAVQLSLQHGLDVAIVGDNDFYSQRAQLAALGLPRTLASLSSLQPFSPAGVSLSEVHKTGLGSSAALITSLVAAVLRHTDVISAGSIQDHNSKGRTIIHNVAQFVHCLAQGKIGSGFDVSAAIFGTHVYRRFSPRVLDPIMSESPSKARFSILMPTNHRWDNDVKTFELPPLTRLMLADVDAGSDTPSLVGKVLNWRKNNREEAKALWREIDQLNSSVGTTFARLGWLHNTDPASYSSALKYLSSLQPVQWTANPFAPEKEIPIINTLYGLHNISQTIRMKMKAMGMKAEVPIEPDEQTRLLDVCLSQAGVICGGVPGAGGYDAIWLLVCDPVDCSPDQRPSERVERIWSTYTDLNVSPLSAVESSIRGINEENLEEVRGLKDVVIIPH